MDGNQTEFDIYEKGEGPIIVILQELPGIESEMIKFADKIAAAGFRVVMPHLFAPWGNLRYCEMSSVCSVSGAKSIFLQESNPAYS